MVYMGDDAKIPDVSGIHWRAKTTGEKIPALAVEKRKLLLLYPVCD